MKMRRKKEAHLVPKLLKRIAPRLGASVLLEPNWRVAGQITFRGGKKSYFRYNALDLNPVGASDIAKDKDYAAFFMRRMGYPAVRGKTFLRDDFADAIGSAQNGKAAAAYAERRYPLVAKPNSGSQGIAVAVVHHRAELREALEEIFKNDRVALLQPLLRGRDYRIVVLENRVISAYERIPLSVVGDGRSTILGLMREKQRAFLTAGRDTRIKSEDPRIGRKLLREKLSLRSVPAKGSRIFLLDNANLSSGGDAADVTDAIHPDFKKLAIRLTKDMGLRIAGVDLLVRGSIAEPPKKYHILEINAAPGLDHYVKTGREQRLIVEKMYLEIIKSIAKG